jgi:P27 family predicted phage terminase small subunit
MTAAQKIGWQHAIAHAPKGLLRHLDASLLAVWVVAEDMHREAALKVAKFGMLVQSPKQRTPIQSPYLPIINRQAEIMMRAASELGFTPTSRSRITLGGEGQAKNRFQNNGKRTTA